jgi:hypothetical protein
MHALAPGGYKNISTRQMEFRPLAHLSTALLWQPHSIACSLKWFERGTSSARLQVIFFLLRHNPMYPPPITSSYPDPRNNRRPADLLTFRHEDELVYVMPAHSHAVCASSLAHNTPILIYGVQQAIVDAKSAYPYLTSTPSERISFAVGVFVQGNPSKVTIAPSAWSTGKPNIARSQ